MFLNPAVSCHHLLLGGDSEDLQIAGIKMAETGFVRALIEPNLLKLCPRDFLMNLGYVIVLTNSNNNNNKTIKSQLVGISYMNLLP